MSKPTKPRVRTIVLAAVFLLPLGPLWLWNCYVAQLPLYSFFEFSPGRLMASTEPLINQEGWLNGSSLHGERDARPVTVLDLTSGRQMTLDQQPLELYQNNHRFTFARVPFMNGYSVRIEDLSGDKPPREMLANLFGQPLLVSGHYLVWSRKGFFEVVDLDQDKLTVIESLNPRFTGEHSLVDVAVPDSDRFFSIYQPLSSSFAVRATSQVELFKIEQGRVIPVANWQVDGVAWNRSIAGELIFTPTARDTLEVHSLVDGRLVKEVAIPDAMRPAHRLVGRLLAPIRSNSAFDLVTERYVKLPSPSYWPWEVDNSLAFFMCQEATYQTRLWVYDLDKGQFKYQLDLPFAPRSISLEGEQLQIASTAHGMSALIIDADTGRTIKRLEPNGWLSRSAGLLVLCLALWCVTWVALAPTGIVWLDNGVVVSVLILFLFPYSAFAHIATIVLVFAGFALWQSGLSTEGSLSGMLLCLVLGAPGLFILSFDVPRQSLFPFQFLIWMIVIALTTTVWRISGYRFTKKNGSPTDNPKRLGIGHLMIAVAIVALWTTGLREYNWLMLERVSKEMPAIAAIFTVLFSFCCWLGAHRPRWLNGRAEFALSVGVLSSIAVPRIFQLWYGYSLLVWAEGWLKPGTEVWLTALSQLEVFGSGKAEDLWEYVAISLAGPYLLGVAFRQAGSRWHRLTGTEVKRTESRQALDLAGE